jgi:hypothetical protein
VAIYNRLFIGDIIDYCIVYNDITYHHKDKSKLVADLRYKIKEQERIAEARLNGSWITVQVCKDLGFCIEGISDFINAFGLGSYSSKGIDIDELATIVKRDLHLAYPFKSELTTLAKKFGREDLITYIK